MRIKDLIEKAGGLNAETYMERADIVRTRPNGSLKNIFINLSSALEGQENDNILLKSGDVIKIYNSSAMLFRSDLEILGHVTNPGVKKFKNGMKLKDLIWEGGGFKNTQHLKNTYFARAELSRTNKNLSSSLIPFRLDSVLEGNGKADLELQMGDIVTIFSIQEITGEDYGYVDVQGEVKSPGRYPFHERMTLNDLLFSTGALEDTVYASSIFKGRGDIIRKSNSSSSEIISFDLNKVFNQNVKKNKKEIIYLEKFDLVRIYSNKMFETIKTVFINGDITNPGKYELLEKMTLKDLILFAGGVDSSVYSFKAEIASVDPLNKNLNSYAKIKTFDMLNDTSQFSDRTTKRIKDKIYLNSLDMVTIRKSPYLSAYKKVFVGGMVNYPGSYVIKGPGELITDILKRAGGLKLDAYLKASTFIRSNKEIKISLERLVKNPKSKLNFTIQGGDSILIGSKTNIVSVIGEVNMPGNFQYVKNTTFKEYIRNAGGLTPDASGSKIVIQHIDGKNKLVTRYSRTKIYDGTTILVSRGEDVEPFNITQYVTDVTQIWADIIQSYAMISILFSGNN